MKYLVLLIGEGDLPPWDELSPQEQAAGMEKFGAFAAACAARDGVSILGGEALAPASAATVMRTRGGALSLTDGPYAESVEQLGGFYLIEAPDLDTLVELLRLLPPFDIQICPVVDIDGSALWT